MLYYKYSLSFLLSFYIYDLSFSGFSTFILIVVMIEIYETIAKHFQAKVNKMNHKSLEEIRFILLTYWFLFL